MTTKLNPFTAILIGGALGVGGRGLSEVLRHAKNPKLTQLPEDPPAIQELPVSVSKEEAEELRRRGMKVKRAFQLSTGTGSMDAINAAAGVLAAAGGWRLANKYFSDKRQAPYKAQLAATKDKLDRMLEEDPDDELGSAMNKVAAFLALPDALLGQLPIAGWALGGGAALLGLKKFDDYSEKSKSADKLKKMKRFLELARTKQQQVELVPVERGG